MYSFGIILFELLCGRESIIDTDSNKYLAPLALIHYREKRLDEIIDWDIWNQMDSQSFDIFTETAYDCLNEERSQRPNIDEIATRLEKALELELEHQKAIHSSPNHLAHLRIPLEDIESATNYFGYKNFIGEDGLGKRYEGQLLWFGELIDITARRLITKEWNEIEQQFWTEISMLSSLKHENIDSIVGFCNEVDAETIIYKDISMGRLENYVSDPMLLTWVKRLKICVRLARALSYIHYDEQRDFSVIHWNISSYTVVLDDDWEPKLSDFLHSMKIKTSERHHSFHTDSIWSTKGYTDPTCLETGTVNHKSDIYSFGIVLFELLCGRKSIINDHDNKYLAPVAMFHYREKKLENMIDHDLLKQMDLHSFNMFAEIAYECLDEKRSQRPNIDDIVPRLEKALESARENRPIHSSPNHLAHLRIPLEDIESATNYFGYKNFIGEDGLGKRYEGQLSWSGELIDITALRLTSNKEWDDEIEQQFWMEISMLSSLKHKNLVPIVGFCNEVDAETIIYKDISMGRLENYVSDPMLLTWVKRLKICVRLARALSYIHYDEQRDFSVIHRNISSYTVLLDDDWEPKLSDFLHSMKIKTSERHHSFHTDSIWSIKGYTDPTCLETGTVNHKSDIYSFGIVLFELLCGRKSIINDHDNKYLAPVAMFHYREKILNDIIDPDLLKQMDLESFNVFAKTAYDSLNEERSRRPDIVEVVTRLEEALKLQLARENRPEHSIVATKVEEFRNGTIFKGRLLHSQQFIDIAAKKSSKILLDDEWEPKLSGFELSLKNAVARRHRLLLTRDIVKNPYMDPRYEKTGGVTHKSDVYSFGVVLLEMDPESFKIFSETTYYCIQEERAKRPHIDHVVKRLEKALGHQWRYENPVDRTSSSQLKGKNLEHLKIGLNDIKEATSNFDNAYIIGSGGFGKVYKANLEHFDSSNSSSKEGVNECVLPRKRSTVAIKRIYNQEGEQGFIAEIETLTSCKHENIISLIGFCYEGNGTMILVYEHALKGSLENYLGSSDKMNLTWVQRLNICLDIAHGLNYIHNNTDHGKQKMIHRDIKSDNILLGDNWKAKIADFGLSKFHPADQSASTFYTSMIAGTYVYLDPEYQKDGKLSKKSDIYSFGVVLLEILTGRLAYDSVYTNVNKKGLAPIARDHFEKRTVMEIVDHKIKEETDEHVFSLSKGPNKESLDGFLEITFRCVAETQAQRPTIEVVIKELKKALNCQENHKDNLKLSLEDVKLATQDFSKDNMIGPKDFGNVYRGVVTHAHGHNIIAAKRLNRKSAAKDTEFMTELEILMEYKHEHVIALVGYCNEKDEKIIVYEYASKGSLDNYLSDDSLTWVMRLKICIDIASGLRFFMNCLQVSEMNVDYVIDNVMGTIGYRDPLHSKTGFLTKESDIFSLGAVLFDILCGKLSSEKLDDEYLYLPFLAKHHYHVGKLDKLVFEGIKEQIVPQSYITFARIAFQCLHHMRERRPTADEVVIQLKKSLEFQEDYEKWEPKLPKDYKEIIQMSKCPDDYSTIKKEELYNIFLKGILLQQDKVLLSFVGNGERNEMVSATMFSYINSCPHELKSLQESRFETVVEMLDITDLNIEIKTRAQFLSPNVVYGVYLVFKFCDSRNFSSKPVYVNLKYRKGCKSMHAYFATLRDEQWMMIELHRFLSQKEDVIFEFLLESFSSYYCGDAAVYVEGIEFRVIDKVKHEEIGKLKEVQQVLKSDLNMYQLQQLPTNFEEIFKVCRNYDELFWLGEVEGKKLLVLSAKAALYKFSIVDTFASKPPAQSRFKEVIELFPQQVFHIKCTIKSQLLSPDTEYVCYLLFKLSENCQGMHCPVKVRDILHQEKKEAEFLYFITPEPLNIHDITRVPKQREDGWMEIQLWKFNSAHEFKDDSLSMNMRFTSLEGTMPGLIVCGLEFRPL
ncbi:kinase-like domain, phloem protein 2-like protein [Tanacetum coccineum]